MGVLNFIGVESEVTAGALALLIGMQGRIYLTFLLMRPASTWFCTELNGSSAVQNSEHAQTGPLPWHSCWGSLSLLAGAGYKLIIKKLILKCFVLQILYSSA